MIPPLRVRRVILIGLLLIIFLGSYPMSILAETYDSFVTMLQNPNSKVQMMGKEQLALFIKKNLLKSQFNYGPEQYTENIFYFGYFTNTKIQDLAIGISLPPYRGNLVILSQKDGHYTPMSIITGIGFVESMKSANLFPGPLEQLVLNLYGGGSGWQHWGTDIYRWDGASMRMIWAWIREDVFKKWPASDNKPVGTRLRSQINFSDSNNDGYREIITSDKVEEGVFSVTGSDLEQVLSRDETTSIHRWDESLFFFVSRYGEIIVPNITVSCTMGIPQKQGSEILSEGKKLGILEPPGYFKFGAQAFYHTIIGKEHFCEIPKHAIRLIN
jgi:hypothetical protein